MGILLNQNRLVALLQHVTDSTMAVIEALRVHAVDFTHAPGRRRAKRHYQKMIVIRHLAPRPDAPVETPAHRAEIINECLPVLVVQKNIGLRIPGRIRCVPGRVIRGLTY